jgi:hypothetical protein
MEWAEMTPKRKWWYIAVSVLYMGLIGFVGCVSIAGGVHFLQNGPWKMEVPFGTMAQGLGTILCMLLIATVQIGRVFRIASANQERSRSCIGGTEPTSLLAWRSGPGDFPDLRSGDIGLVNCLANRLDRFRPRKKTSRRRFPMDVGVVLKL